MKFSVAVAAAVLSSVAYAQLPDTSGLPLCAQGCILSSLDAACGLTDIACNCKSASYTAKFTTCVQSACTAAEQTTAGTWGYQTCLKAGVTITVPTPSAAPSTTPVAVSTSTTVVATETTTAAEETTKATTWVTTTYCPTGSVPTNGTTVTTAAPTYTGAATHAKVGGAAALGLGALIAALL